MTLWHRLLVLVARLDYKKAYGLHPNYRLALSAYGSEVCAAVPPISPRQAKDSMDDVVLVNDYFTCAALGSHAVASEAPACAYEDLSHTVV